jgi:biopolymer transport protein ExbD
MIHSPGLRKQRRARRALFADLNLTSLVDVLVVLLIFGLVTFEEGGELP